MTDDLNRQLRDADPLAREGELSPDTSEAMRRAVVASLDDAQPRNVWWNAPALAAAVGLAAVVAVMVASLARTHVAHEANTDAAVEQTAQPTAQSQTRQVQFQTPGGTKIVWVLNPDLEF